MKLQSSLRPFRNVSASANPIITSHEIRAFKVPTSKFQHLPNWNFQFSISKVHNLARNGPIIKCGYVLKKTLDEGHNVISAATSFSEIPIGNIFNMLENLFFTSTLYQGTLELPRDCEPIENDIHLIMKFRGISRKCLL